MGEADDEEGDGEGGAEEGGREDGAGVHCWWHVGRGLCVARAPWLGRGVSVFLVIEVGEYARAQVFGVGCGWYVS